MNSSYRRLPGITAPCKDCPDHAMGCHSKCDKYAEFKKQVEEYNETVRKAKKIDKEFYEFKAKKRKK